MGPFKQAGVILDELKAAAGPCTIPFWTGKVRPISSITTKDLSPGFDKNRAIRADKLFFNPDGSIQKVKPTLRGVGLVKAKSEIQIDRFSAKSPRAWPSPSWTTPTPRWLENHLRQRHLLGPLQ